MSINLTLEGISASLGEAHGPSNGWYKYEWCPVCKNEHPDKPAFAVNWKTGVFKCHDCDEKGTITDLLINGSLEPFGKSEDKKYESDYETLDKEFYQFNIVENQSLTNKYLCSRGIEFATIKMLDVPLREGRDGTNRIAVYPFFNKTGDVVSFQSTFLESSSSNLSEKTRRYKGKKSLGVGVLRHQKKMIICEGLETGLSVLQRLGREYGLIVCGDANGMKSLADKNIWALKGVRHILIAADNDKSNTGIKAARVLAYALPKKSSIFMPSLPGADWNDVLLNDSFEEEWL